MAAATDWSKFKDAPLYAQNQGIVNSFKLTDWWWNGQVDDEPVLPQNGGVEQRFSLWKPATNIIQVVQYATGKTLVAGTDYTLDASTGDLILPASTTAVSAPAGFVSTPDPNSPYLSQSKTKEGGGLYLGNDYVNFQLAVTYQTKQMDPPEVDQLPGFYARLTSQTPTAMTFFGDSITQGAVSSSSNNQAPMMPGYVDLVGAYISTVAPGWFYWRNQSLSGLSSGGAVQQVSLITDTPSDVYVIALGMNDAGGNVPKATFKANIQSIINSALAQNSSAQFILIAGISANPDWINYYPRARGYREVLMEIAGTSANIVVCDVLGTWEAMLARKNTYYDVTANGVNHPGDFGHRLYAQNMIQMLFGSE